MLYFHWMFAASLAWLGQQGVVVGAARAGSSGGRSAGGKMTGAKTAIASGSLQKQQSNTLFKATETDRRRTDETYSFDEFNTTNMDERAVYNEAYVRWISRIQDRYENYIRPFFGGPPVNISISIYVMAFRSVSEVTMDYSMEIYFRQSWMDDRLAFDRSLFPEHDEIDIDLSARHLLWMPDTNLVNAMQTVNPMPGSLSHVEHVRVRNDGRVYQTKRVSVTAECNMNLRLYPFDEQACKLIISSYGFRNRDLLYEWATNAVETTATTQLPDFTVTRQEIKQYTALYATGNFSTLEYCFIVKRHAGYCVVQLMFPATVLVASSWISLWLEDDMVYSDVIGVILSILFLSYNYNNVMPKVSYIKGMDIYLGACLLFCFISLVKMAIVKHLRRVAQRENAKETEVRRRLSLINSRTVSMKDALQPEKPDFLIEKQGRPHEKQGFASERQGLLHGKGDYLPVNRDFTPQKRSRFLPENQAPISNGLSVHQLTDQTGETGFRNRSISIGTNEAALNNNNTVAESSGVLQMMLVQRLMQQMLENQCGTGTVFGTGLGTTSALDRVHTQAWRNMKRVHYGSQIVLPLTFTVFSVCFIVLFPMIQEAPSC